MLAQAADVVDTAQLVPPYRLPRNPANLYEKQTAPLMKATPEAVVFQAKKFHEDQSRDWRPFERSERKIPAEIRPDHRGPATGPMTHPNDPIWCEMNHRLQNILKKQGRRAERRRKRRIRSKLFGGKGSKGGKQTGRALREYLDRAALRAQGLSEGMEGDPSGEFLGKVQEQYLQRREALEAHTRRFQIPGPSSRDLQSRVVRPVYMPPPPGTMVLVSD